MNHSVQTYEAEINQIVVETFQTMLATDVAGMTEAWCSDRAVTALVAFTGTWQGVLTFECGSQAAICFAQRFLQDETIDSVNDDVCDSLGEIANIVAGNLKSVLAPGLSLGTPSVVEGKDYHVRFCGGYVVNKSSFATEVGPFTVRLVENAKVN
jgi:chemotaxis protein CheX